MMSIIENFPPPGLDVALATALVSGIVLKGNSSYGMGTRAMTFLHCDSDEDKWQIEIFAEMLVEQPPIQSAIGYTEAEIVSNSGVFVSKVIGKRIFARQSRTAGVYMSIPEFEKYVTNPSTRALLFMYVEKLKQNVIPSDEAIESYSNSYTFKNPELTPRTMN